jgi:hypothetical protein
VGFVRILIGLSANILVVQNGSESSGQIANSQLSTDDNRFVMWQALEPKIHFVFVGGLQIIVDRGQIAVDNFR